MLVAEGKLEGCYAGAGRARRFDSMAAARQLDVKLDRGQAIGHGATAAQARRSLLHLGGSAEAEPAPQPAVPVDPDADRYKKARAEIAEADARLRRLKIAAETGRWVLASEVDRAASAALTAELGQMGSMLRDGARAAADRTGAEYREIKAALFEVWRAHCARRRDDLLAQADAAGFSEAERAEMGRARAGHRRRLNV